jgi:hypothetical protein
MGAQAQWSDELSFVARGLHIRRLGRAWQISGAVAVVLLLFFFA